MWLHLKLITNVVSACGNLFPTVDYAYTTVPSYPSGQIGFIMCSLDGSPTALRRPVRTPSFELQSKLRYYSPTLHTASFVLPQFAENEIMMVRKRSGRVECGAGSSPVIRLETSAEDRCVIR
jgi:spermidine synthase